jgi:hypothetical protein
MNGGDDNLELSTALPTLLLPPAHSGLRQQESYQYQQYFLCFVLKHCMHLGYMGSSDTMNGQ